MDNRPDQKVIYNSYLRYVADFMISLVQISSIKEKRKVELFKVISEQITDTYSPAFECDGYIVSLCRGSIDIQDKVINIPEEIKEKIFTCATILIETLCRAYNIFIQKNIQLYEEIMSKTIFDTKKMSNLTLDPYKLLLLLDTNIDCVYGINITKK